MADNCYPLFDFCLQECKISTFSFLEALSLPVSRQFEKVVLSNEVSFVIKHNCIVAVVIGFWCMNNCKSRILAASLPPQCWARLDSRLDRERLGCDSGLQPNAITGPLRDQNGANLLKSVTVEIDYTVYYFKLYFASLFREAKPCVKEEIM